MLQRIKYKHVKQAVYMMAYGASKRKAKQVLKQGRKMTPRQAASAVKWAEFTLAQPMIILK